RADAGAVDGALRPVQLAGSVESFEQDGVDLLPGAVGLPVPQPAPARHPAPAVHLGWQVLPRQARPEHGKDAGQGLPVRGRRPAALRAQRGQRREQGLDDLPQGVGQQRLGHPWRPPIGGRQFARKSAAGQVKLGFLTIVLGDVIVAHASDILATWSGATMKLTTTERWILSNQYLILAALCPDNAKTYADAREAIDRGYELEYPQLTQHISNDPLSVQECAEVLDIMQMFWEMQFTYDNLEDRTGIAEHWVKFPGFDGTDETKYMFYAGYITRPGSHRFENLHRRQSNFNSHAPLLGHYRKMYAEYVRSNNRHELTKDDLVRITNVK